MKKLLFSAKASNNLSSLLLLNSTFQGRIFVETSRKFICKRCPDIDTEGLRKLGDTMKDMKSLKEAHLIFEW